MTHFIDGQTKIYPVFRGAERAEFGVRRTVGKVEQFDFSIDGGPDDIIGYRLERDADPVMFNTHLKEAK